MKNNKFVKWSSIGVGVLLLAYIASIVWFEAQLGMNQPQGSTSLVIATFNDDNERHERVLRLEQIDGQNYIAANHWPRSWYNQALDNSNVEVKMPGNDNFEAYLAIPLEGAEEERIREIYAFGFEFRFRTGFPPRYFLRLDPRG
ncbi:MAG: hypothetical protein COB20_12675 [SAR86 cluster bacterium]|uniref:DUF385 domain-containing protein n=1 Tax=SAR86 cluster bacterium TaxID=2030880 RepID=A0A2A4WZS6_9GAMM|nr:MAG: hypothetical protein COB20_12675 [SAR86 cluster bacterium]